MMTRLALLSALLASIAFAQDGSLGDPAKVATPPAHAIGFPRRDAQLDALPGFKTPPPGYGEVAFYWWIGDPLTKERLTWQLDQLAGKGVMGLQINYAHTDRGGLSYGLSIPSDPPLFSREWWELTGWFMQEAKRRGMAISLSDYTLGIGQGFAIDQILKESPELNGTLLRSETRDAAGGKPLEWAFKSPVVSVMAYRVEAGKVIGAGATDLRAQVKDDALRWTPPEGNWRIVAVMASPVIPSLDPMHPRSGPEYAKKFFGAFEDHHPGEGGKGLNFFFSDELEFRIHGNLWNARFADEFKKRKGYDLLPELPALFIDIGPRTPKIRLDYSDVKVALTEEGFFKPVFDWHQQRGMIYGCDHGGRGRNVIEFGDYFRTQRWNQGPGCDQPGLGRDITKNKVASSIAHLYNRPRVWLEGFYGSGWGTSSEALTDAIFANMAMGQNLMTFHGLYYTTHGGWWEWAPPCNHFRMPYWKQIDPLMTCIQRLSYLLSQGHHRCDVAVVYPVAPMEAGMDGGEAVKTAFATGTSLYTAGVDFDYMDFESLARATVQDRQLEVSGESYRVLVLPAMKAVRYSTLEKAREFYRAGGIVVAVGALPQASDRAGREDPEVEAMVKEIFGTSAQAAARSQDVIRHANEKGGVGLVVTKHEPIIAELSKRLSLDFSYDYKGNKPYIMHRKIGPRDVYALYGGEKDAIATFRAAGKVELWDPWTGQTRELPVIKQTDQLTSLRLPLTEKEMQVLVFSPGQARIEREAPVAAEPRTIAVEGDWEFEPVPTLDNRFGDYRWPPTPTLIGPEARQFRWARETAANPNNHEPTTDDSKWPTVTCGFGPQFWKLGPLPVNADIEKELLALPAINPAQAVAVSGKRLAWQPYEFSWRYGLENDPGHQGYHGLKEEITDDFLALGKLKRTATSSAYEAEAEGTRYYLWTSVIAPGNVRATLRTGGNKPAAAWVNGQPAKPGAVVQLKSGPNLVLLRYDKPGRGHAVFDLSAKPVAASNGDAVFSADARYIWFPNDRGRLALFRKSVDLDKLPEAARLRITCDNGYTLYVNGASVGRGGAWQRVQQYDVLKHLKPGRNLIAVEARNEGDSAGLIAELTMGNRRIATDATWRCVRQNAEGWLEANFNDQAWTPAEAISNFTDSLWYKHQNGPPALDEAALTPSAAAKNVGPLAMAWHQNKEILRFDPFPAAPADATAAPTDWYRFTAPPGLRAMRFAAHGAVQAWANGQPCDITAGAKAASGAIAYTMALKNPAAAPVKIALRIVHDPGFSGGLAIPDPIALDCGKGLVALGDWSTLDGLRSYSGGARYGKTIDLGPDIAASRITLDLGKVVASAEVFINGQSAGVRVAPPWSFDLSPLAKPGENKIEILVYNTLANHYLTIPTRYRGKLDAGLIGPVTIQITPAR